ncbi:MAG: hypothetical protein KBB01_00500 [Candidatus Omnitrophica bacterium]|jgi:Flp pilus assembly pilin Flp|nr:hypothetical protein [Candidatus Omnitrophota bacterium]
MLLKPRKAQSTLEYALLITVVIAVLLSMQAYIKRGMQGKFKDVTDQIGDQYSPGLTQGTYHLDTTSTTTETYNEGHNTRLNVVTSGNQNTTTDQDIKPLHKESFPVNFEWE